MELKKRPSKENPPTGSPFPKPTNRYDDFVLMHMLSFSRDPSQMFAHGSPTFLPWHRAYLRIFEKELQKIKPEFSNVTIPYWDWTNRESDKVLWNQDLMGGNGREEDGRVMDGSFAYEQGNWTLYTAPDIDSRYKNPDLTRRHGLYIEDGQQFELWLPSSPFVKEALGTDPYDKETWDRSSYPSFRTALEGFYGDESIHNIVHAWVGGQIIDNNVPPGTSIYKFAGTMSYGGSPNDPVFWLHHANIDRLWADWQLDSQHWNLEHKGYLPINNGPDGFRANANMLPWQNISPAKVANFYIVGGNGYKYKKYYRDHIRDVEEKILPEVRELIKKDNIVPDNELTNTNLESIQGPFESLKSTLSKDLFPFKKIK